MLFCDNCLENILENAAYFEAVSGKGQHVILCRVCFYASDFICPHMKEDFTRCEERDGIS